MAQAEKVYFCTMYVRKKHNRSGSTSVVVVSKASGKYKEIKLFGSSISKEGIDSLCEQAATWIRSFGYQQELDFDDRKGKEVEETKRFLSNIDNVLINGTQILLNQIYDNIGFNRIPDEILRHLVIARVSQPGSKLVTVDYLKSYYDEDVDLNHIYRYMDKLYNTQMELAHQISVEHTRKLFGDKIGLMFKMSPRSTLRPEIRMYCVSRAFQRMARRQSHRLYSVCWYQKEAIPFHTLCSTAASTRVSP